ncbi:hypothetical protein ACWEQL_30485, partial [Kitasatospora sp. NPDC004240]
SGMNAGTGTGMNAGTGTGMNAGTGTGMNAGTGTGMNAGTGAGMNAGTGTGLNTYQRLAVALHELGMISRQKADEALASTADRGEPEPQRRTEELTGVLELCAVALQVHGEDADVAQDAHAGILKDAQRMIGGALTVTAVELVGEIGSTRDLGFTVNGAPKS